MEITGCLVLKKRALFINSKEKGQTIIREKRS